MITAILVDDEKHSRENLKVLLEQYCPEVRVLHTAGSVKEAKESIEKYKPELVFLDINMPTGDGFLLFDESSEIDFEVIFVTAYDQYAIKAFRYAALDYILKPININHLIEAVSKFTHKDQTGKQAIGALNYYHNKKAFDKIVLPVANGFEFVSIDKIIRIEADGNYSWIHMADRKPLLISKSLQMFESTLSETQFIRIHRAHLVNIDYVTFFDAHQNSLTFSDGSSAFVSARKKAFFIKMFSEFTLGK